MGSPSEKVLRPTTEKNFLWQQNGLDTGEGQENVGCGISGSGLRFTSLTGGKALMDGHIYTLKQQIINITSTLPMLTDIVCSI